MKKHAVVFAGALALVTTTHAFAQEDEERQEKPKKAQASESDLAKTSQNPIANLLTVPLQQQFNFGYGPGRDSTQYVLNIEPVIPAKMGDDWLFVSRTILPLVDQPVSPGDRTLGLGDVSASFFAAPSGPHVVTWGAGPALVFPTATDSALGAGKWSVGPTAVVVASTGAWVFGTLASSVWSYAGASDRTHVASFLVEPFINYNLAHGWALTSSPIITTDWHDPAARLLVPVGGGVSKTSRVGKQVVQVSAQGYWNMIHPGEGPVAQARVTAALLLPE
jgi:hypothetical protein